MNHGGAPSLPHPRRGGHRADHVYHSRVPCPTLHVHVHSRTVYHHPTIPATCSHPCGCVPIPPASPTPPGKPYVLQRAPSVPTSIAETFTGGRPSPSPTVIVYFSDHSAVHDCLSLLYKLFMQLLRIVGENLCLRRKVPP